MGNQQGVGGTTFPYEVTDTSVYSFKSGWELRNGWYKSDRKPVSVFIYNIGSGHDALAHNFLRRFKTLRHPHILPWIDGIELETKKQIYIVTERVRPLVHSIEHLRTQKFVISWGVHQILKAVAFLGSTGLVHGNVTPEAIFINKQGDWKLGGFELLTEFAIVQKEQGSLFDGLPLIGQQYLPPELAPDKRNQLSRVPPPSIDTWMTGCTLFALFSSKPFSDRNQLKQIEVLPKDLHTHYVNLITANPMKRGSLTEFLSESLFFQNPLVDACLFLEEITVRETYEKERFFLKLPKLLEEFPEEISKYKILPHLVKALDFGSIGSIGMDSLLQITKTLTEEEFTSDVTPSLVKWFKNNDRQMRLHLLENISDYSAHLTPAHVNESVYTAIAQHFFDQSPSFKNLAIQAVFILAPKLSVANINNHLLKCLAKLQTDPDASVRTNTTVCIAKIAENLTPDTRTKVLIPAFTRSLRDPFPLARQSGLQGLASSAKFFTIHDCATKVMPACSWMAVDSDPEVRAVAVKAMKTFLEIIEKGQSSIAADFANATTGGTKVTGGSVAELAAVGETVLGGLWNLSTKFIGTTVSSTPDPSHSSQSEHMGAISSKNAISSKPVIPAVSATTPKPAGISAPTITANLGNIGNIGSTPASISTTAGSGGGNAPEAKKKKIIVASPVTSWDDDGSSNNIGSNTGDDNNNIDGNIGGGWGDNDDSLFENDFSIASFDKVEKSRKESEDWNSNTGNDSFGNNMNDWAPAPAQKKRLTQQTPQPSLQPQQTQLYSQPTQTQSKGGWNDRESGNTQNPSTNNYNNNSSNINNNNSKSSGWSDWGDDWSGANKKSGSGSAISSSRNFDTSSQKQSGGFTNSNNNNWDNWGDNFGNVKTKTFDSISQKKQGGGGAHGESSGSNRRW